MPQASEKVSAPSRPALRLVRGNSIRLSLFGGFAARSSNCAGGPPPVSAPRHQAMLAYLAMRPRFSETRERLAALLWSESGEVQARQNLRQCLVRIRRDFAPLGIDPVIVSPREIRLDPARITVDAMEFHDLARSGQPQDLEAAMALYQGAFLSGLNLGQETFDEWHQAEHARFERAAAQVMQKCARHRDQSGDGAGAVRAAESLVAVDSLNEDSQRLYLRMLARHQGREAALGHARTLARLIKHELDCALEPETASLIAEIQRGSDTIAPPAALLQAFSGPSLAVMPFRNLGVDPGQEYIAIGLAEDITTALARLRWLHVIAQGSAAAHEADPGDPAKAARERGIRYVLDGSVRTAGGRIRISVQLIDAAAGTQIWAEKYDRGLADIFAVQDEIAGNTAAAIEPRLYAAEGRRAAAGPPERLDCWGLVVQAIQLIHRFGRIPNEQAREMLTRAVELDPAYARAHALLSWALYWAKQGFWVAAQDAALSSATKHAEQALALDPHEPWARMTFGFSLSTAGKHDRAVEELQAALDLNPSFALGRMIYGWALLRAGHFEQAVTETASALRLSPLDGVSGMYKGIHGLSLLAMRRFKEALPFLRASVTPRIELMGNYNSLICCYGHLGEIDEARRLLEFRQEQLGKPMSLRGVIAQVGQFAHGEVFVEGLRKAGVPE